MRTIWIGRKCRFLGRLRVAFWMMSSAVGWMDWLGVMGLLGLGTLDSGGWSTYCLGGLFFVLRVYIFIVLFLMGVLMDTSSAEVDKK
jgi:hypothetical protein